MNETETRIAVIEQSLRQAKSEMQVKALIGLALCECARQLSRMTEVVQDESYAMSLSKVAKEMKK